MPARLVEVAALLFICTSAVAQSRPERDLPRFMGRAVTITEPERDPDGFFPKGPASVCLEGPPQRQCYTAPDGFGIEPKVNVVQLEKDMPALFFSVASGGVSGFAIRFALLRPGTGKNLRDLFMSDVSVSEQSRNAFWTDPGVSDAQFFITADYVWGPDEAHYSPHRYIISAYVQKPSSLVGGYHLEDRYMTVRTYDMGYASADPTAGVDILASERPEILTRLRRLKREGDSRRLTH